MIYTDRDSLLQAAMQTEQDDLESLHALGRLLRVYLHAMENPPQGIIGVGAITYAEQQLIAAQLNL